ncbi:MAG: cytochrome c maturation protein CcmE [Pseudomonadota bacterium]
MNSARKQKMTIVFFILFGSAVTVGLILFALNEGINVFFTPTEIAEGKVPAGQNIRIGGMVKEGSLVSDGLEGTSIEFITTDTNADVKVAFTGVLPDLFREGQGVVAEGVVDADGVFQANQILAKHDENYMSAEVKAAMDAAKKKQAAEVTAQ